MCLGEGQWVRRAALVLSKQGQGRFHILEEASDRMTESTPEIQQDKFLTSVKGKA